jgi:putative alpha-1,2-mannosidase
MYKPTPAGLCGNDDCGQMSAWYVMSALGIYPMNPVNGEYVFGSPIVDKAVIHLENGKKFTIIAKNNSKKNIYIQNATLNGNLLKNNLITYKNLLGGGKLVFKMSDKK